MNRIPVVSNAVKAIGYHDVTRHLEIEYHNGKVYRYQRVPARVHTKLINSPSIGHYLNLAVKPYFEEIELPIDHDARSSESETA